MAFGTIEYEASQRRINQIARTVIRHIRFGSESLSRGDTKSALVAWGRATGGFQALEDLGAYRLRGGHDYKQMEMIEGALNELQGQLESAVGRWQRAR